MTIGMRGDDGGRAPDSVVRRGPCLEAVDGDHYESDTEAEQTELLVRLAADSGARRGELAALKIGDLEGRVLQICRNISGGCTVTAPVSHQYRSVAHPWRVDRRALA